MAVASARRAPSHTTRAELAAVSDRCEQVIKASPARCAALQRGCPALQRGCPALQYCVAARCAVLRQRGEPRQRCAALQRGCPALRYCAAARCAALRQRGAPCSARPARRRARGTSPAGACATHSPPLRGGADGSVSVGVHAVPGGSHVDGTALSMRKRAPVMRIRGLTMRIRGLVIRTRLELPLARPERRLRLRVLQHAATPPHATYSTPHRAAARETAARTTRHAVCSNTATARCGGLLSARLTSAHSTAPLCTCHATAE